MGTAPRTGKRHNAKRRTPIALADGIDYRAMMPGEYEIVHAIRCKMHAELKGRERECSEQCLKDDRRMVVNPLAGPMRSFLACLEDEVIGGTTMFVVPSENTCYVGAVYVELQYRRSGVGKYLVLLAFLWAREMECNKVQLVAPPTAQPFYKALGFRSNDGSNFEQSVTAGIDSILGRRHAA